MPISTLVTAAAGSLAAGAYANAKFHIAHDMRLFVSGSSPFAAMAYVAKQAQKDELLTFHVLEHQALHNTPDQLFLIFEGQRWTYAQFFDSVTTVGNWLMKNLGVQRGDIVALCGVNTPEYIMIWFALEGIGACPAFINNHLTGQGLFHCIKVSLFVMLF